MAIDSDLDVVRGKLGVRSVEGEISVLQTLKQVLLDVWMGAVKR